jgi:hypothetical protein
MPLEISVHGSFHFALLVCITVSFAKKWLEEEVLL